ncbi:hypothetical protein [Candidatus Phycosocius spiralis]|uniref:Flagella basal body P-ring formation protein FlgA C-terminal domain-containing protein n=1 Tax=Candidatus Phycosocius spiralis TaxID=2815099 RepID=A0ABQ4PYB8_9PROT|nr:hypothetical protein [Candidatus Phycosocius spiralis]GIU68062.1 hypothetical protein PsB1_2216 [Candidatus Phycosocius spiralis]
MLHLVMLAMMAGVVVDHNGCVAAKRRIEVFEAIWKEDLVVSPCPRDKVSAVLWERNRHVLMARQAIAKGTLLGRISSRPKPIAVEGDRLNMIVRFGPIAIERPVTVLTASRHGSPILVRSIDGKVFSANFEDLTDKRAVP